MKVARLDGIEPPTLGFEDRRVRKSVPSDRVASISAAEERRIRLLARRLVAGAISLADAESQAVGGGK